MEERGEIEGANDEDGAYPNRQFHNVYHYQPHPAESETPEYHGSHGNQQGSYPQVLPQVLPMDHGPVPNMYHPPAQEDEYKVQYRGPQQEEETRDVNDVDLGITSPRREEYADMQDLFLKQGIYHYLKICRHYTGVKLYNIGILLG